MERLFAPFNKHFDRLDAYSSSITKATTMVCFQNVFIKVHRFCYYDCVFLKWKKKSLKLASNTLSSIGNDVPLRVRIHMVLNESLPSLSNIRVCFTHVKSAGGWRRNRAQAIKHKCANNLIANYKRREKINSKWSTLANNTWDFVHFAKTL